MRVLEIEEPSEIRKHLIWIVKDDDEDWGVLRDAVYHDRTFKPNRAAVIVVQQGRNFHADWVQVRETHGGEGWEHCKGTQTLDFESMPTWARAVEEYAVNAVKESQT